MNTLTPSMQWVSSNGDFHQSVKGIHSVTMQGRRWHRRHQSSHEVYFRRYDCDPESFFDKHVTQVAVHDFTHNNEIVTTMLSGNGKSETTVCRDDLYTVLNNQTFLKVVAQVNNSANPIPQTVSRFSRVCGVWLMPVFTSLHLQGQRGC